MANDFIGFDLGSSLTRIYSSKKGEVVFDEPTCICYSSSDKEQEMVGSLAEKLHKNDYKNYKIVYPISNGLVFDDEALFDFLNKIFFEKKLPRFSKAMVSISSLRNKVNEKVLRGVFKQLTLKDVTFVSKGELVCYSQNESIQDPQAKMIVTIGSDYTDIQVISLGGTITSSFLQMGGNTFDEAIKRYVLSDRHVEIDDATAEQLKIMIGSVEKNAEHKVIEAKGKDTITNLPTSILISTEEIKNSLLPTCNYIAMKIIDAFSSVSSTFATDISKNGILIAGGGSLLSGFREYLQSYLKVPVKIAKEAKDAVINGIINKILEEKSKNK